MSRAKPASMPPEEDALPVGHPCRPDYDPDSTEAKEWKARQESLQNASGLPPGYTFDPKRPHGGLVWELGVDPFHPEYEPHFGFKRKASKDETPPPAAKVAK